MKKHCKGYITLKIELKPTDIMRKIVVPANMSLVDLHNAIQSLMGWEGCHLWQFQSRGRDEVVYELPSVDDDSRLPFARRLTINPEKVSLSKVFPKVGGKLVYEYDYGDSWDHVITRMADPSVGEIACVKSVGPDGIEDFGGQWRLAEFIKAHKANPLSEDYAEVREWCGLDTAAEVEAYLAGESAADKTRKLRNVLADVKLPEPVDGDSEPEQSDEEKARRLGLYLAMSVSMEVWKILEEALRNGGTCEFNDPNKELGEYFLTFFDGLKVKDGVAIPFYTNPSRLTVHDQWVKWYAEHSEEWNQKRVAFDLLELYVNSSVHLYGAVSFSELYEIILRYDPGVRLSQDEVIRLLTARTMCPNINYRIDGDLFIDNEVFLMERETVDADIEVLREKHRKIPRWHPETRDELFDWEVRERPKSSTESNGLEFVLRTLCRIPDDRMEEMMDGIYTLLTSGFNADMIYHSLVEANMIERISTKPRQRLLDAIMAWAATLHCQYLNGNTPLAVAEMELKKAAEPKIARNAPCPCGSGKKYKLCCGRTK